MKGIYYQTTRVTHWNLQIIITANAIKWCDIFHLFFGWNKKRKPVMEGNCRLNINFEGHIAELYRLFRYFKNMWPFLLTLISLYKNIFILSYCRMEITPVLSRKRRRFLISLYKIIFLPSCCRMEITPVLSRKRRRFCWWHSPSCLVKFLWCHYNLYFPAIAMCSSRSTIVNMKAPVP